MAWLWATAASGIEPVVPGAGSNLRHPFERGVAFGSDWLAYERDSQTLEVANRATAQMMLRISPPASSPVEGYPGKTRTIWDFGKHIAADGNRLAVLCSSRLSSGEQGSSVFLWEIPSGRLIRVADVFPAPYHSFIGLANGRVVTAGPGSRIVSSWDAGSLNRFPDLVIPDELPAPENHGLSNELTLDIGGDQVVYFNNNYHAERRLIHVNLTTRSIAAIPLAAEYRFVPLFCLNQDRLILAGGVGHDACLLQYDFATSRFGPARVFPSPSGFRVRSVMSADGHWHALLRQGVHDYTLVSGGTIPDSPETVVPIDWLGHDVGDPVALADGFIWFKSLDSAPLDTVAFRQAAPNAPDVELRFTSLPACEADGVLKVKVTASSAADEDVTFRVTTENGSAEAGSDFVAQNAVHRLPAGETEGTIEIPLMQDLAIERGESFFARISELSDNALLVRPQVPCAIRGSPYHLLPPLSPWQKSPDCRPADLTLTGGYLVQANRATGAASSSPVILRRPFDAGDWQASATWNRAMPQNKIEFHDTSDGRALLREYDTASVYQPATDQLIFRLTGFGGDPFRDALSSTRVTSHLDSFKPREHDLAPPHAVPAVALPNTQAYRAAYSDNYLVYGDGSGSHLLLSRLDGSLSGSIHGPKDWRNAAISADGSLLAVHYVNRIWYCDVDGDRAIHELLPPDGPFQDVSSVVATNGRIHVISRPGYDRPQVRIFEAATGVEVDRLLENYHATRLPGSPVFDSSNEWQDFIGISAMAVEGKNAALMYWRDLFSGAEDFHVMRFSESDTLPGLKQPEEIVEGAEVPLRFSEAVAWPVTVTVRAIAAGATQAEDWIRTTESVTVPPGVTVLSSGLVALDDAIPEDPLISALEVTLAANGITEVRRIAVKVTDNDRMAMEDVPTTATSFGGIFAPLGEGWAYRDQGNTGAPSLAWTEDPGFDTDSPLAPPADVTFARSMATGNGWLAVAQGGFEESRFKRLAPMIHIYRPEEGNGLLRSIKRPNDSIFHVLHIRGNSLWAGSPGSEGYGSAKIGSTKVHEYDLLSGKLHRTYRAPPKSSPHFGTALGANDDYTWVGDAALPPKEGTITQYSRATGKRIRVIWPPGQETLHYFGGEFIATDELLIASVVGFADDTHAPFGLVEGISPETGDVLWTLPHPAVGWRENPIALVAGNILAIGNEEVSFYLLTPGQTPRFLVDLKPAPSSSPWWIGDMVANGSQLVIRRIQIDWTYPGKLLDLRSVPQLQPYLGDPAPTPEPVQKVASSGESMTVKATEAGWQLDLPRLPYQTDLPGKKTLLESSTDLVNWTEVARFTGFDSWMLSGDFATALPDGRSFVFPINVPSRIFRLSIVTDPETE